MKATIGIKALNEEAHIADAIASALSASQLILSEIILADSGSSDRTVEIAKEYPIRIVQFVDTAERSCGAAAQLAFQHARGEYFYLLDGDMVLDSQFLGEAVRFLDQNEEFAAVGGLVREMNAVGLEFQIRAKSLSGRNWLPGIVDRLDCGGLYRTSAIRDVGFFSDRNLHAFEEFELGARLQSKGWKLARIDKIAVRHYGHLVGGYRLLWRRLTSGYVSGVGEVLRGAIGQGHFPIVISKLGHIRYGVIVIVWWAILVACLASGLPIGIQALLMSILLLGPIVALAFRRKSLQLGIYSFVSWNANAIGLMTGFFRRRVPPERPIASITLKMG